MSRPTVVVRPLGEDELPAAIGVLSRGMRDNPGHVAAFGRDPARRQRSLEVMFGALFAVVPTLERFCAVSEGVLSGFAAAAPPGTCRRTGWEKARIAGRMATLGPGTLRRVVAWQNIWVSHDPEEPHSHFGPLAVDAHLQGRGIGSELTRAYTRQLDAAGQVGYLETDKPENVTFYQHHGFEVSGEATVVGGPNWFMRRPPMRPATPP